MNNKRPNRYRNAPHTAEIRYVSIADGERDSAFLHNKKGTNSWLLVKRTSQEIDDALYKFHQKYAKKTIDF